MSLSARHHWCAERILFCFASNDDKENNEGLDDARVQSFLRKPKNLSKFNDFFSGKGPAALFVHYQPRHTSELEALDQKVNGSSSKQQAAKRAELFVSSGDSVLMNSRCCYFLRQGDQVDSSIANDTSLLYGEILDSPLETIKSLLSSTYAPLFAESSEWGDTNEEQKADFNDEVNKFVQNLSVAVESISGGLELRELDSTHFESSSSSPSSSSSSSASSEEPAEGQTLEEKAQQEAETIAQLEKLLDEWCGQIEGYMESREKNSSNSQQEKQQHQQLEGPKAEIEYWRSRRQQLSSIAEQLKRKDCKYVVNTLSTYTKGIKLHSKKSSTVALLRRWKQIETDTTEALNESENNSKYLSTLYRFIEPLYSGTAQGIIDTLPALLNSIKVREH
jgi:dynein heavy chain